MESSITQPEKPRDARDRLWLSTITASGPGIHHGKALTELLWLARGLCLQPSDTEGQKNGRRPEEDRTMAEPPVIPKLGGTLVGKAPSWPASSGERAASTQELRVEELQRPGVRSQDLHRASQSAPTRSRGPSLGPSWRTTTRKPPTARPTGREGAEAKPGRTTEPRAWTHLRPDPTRTPERLVRGWRSGAAPRPKT